MHKSPLHSICRILVPLLLTLSLLTPEARAAETTPKDLLLVITIVEADSGEPVVGAIVKSPSARRTQVTDPQGRCTLVFAPGTQRAKISASFLGFRPYEKTITLGKEGRLTIRLEEDATLFDELVVEGQLKHTTNLQQAVAVQAATLEKGTSLNLAKLLESVPGVSSISAGSSISKPVIQGMHSSRIVLVNNGVRLESQSWGEDHAPEIDHTGASIIEVIKGAESVRYGQGALGGVVLFNQATLPYGHKRLYARSKINLGYATNGRAFDGAGSVEVGYRDWGMRLHAMYNKSGDYGTAEYLLNNTGFNNIGFSAYAGYEHGPITATLFSSLYTSRSGIYFFSSVSDLEQLMTRFEIGRPDESMIKPFSYEIKPPFQQTQHFTLKGEVDYRVAEGHNLELKVSYQDNLRQEFENRKRDDLSWLPMQDLLLTTMTSDLAWEGDWKVLGMSTQAGLCSSYQYNYNVPGTKQPAFIPNFAALTLGGFVIHKMKLGNLDLSGGLRYDYKAMDVHGYTSLASFKYYRDFKVYAAITSSLAAHYRLNDNYDVRLNVGLAWRPPDINELYATGLHHGTYWVVGNKDLLPEVGVKPVLGMGYRNEWLLIEPSAFFQYVHNYIYDNIGQGARRFHNHPSGKYPQFIYGQDNARLFGGDLLVRVEPLSGLSIEMTGEWINARNLTQNCWLPFMPSDRYGLGANYRIDFGKERRWHADVTLDGKYVTKQVRFDPEKDLAPDSPDPYFLLNANAELKYDLPGGRSVKLMLVADNMLNALYKEYTDRFRFFAHAMGAKYTIRTVVEF